MQLIKKTTYSPHSENRRARWRDIKKLKKKKQARGFRELVSGTFFKEI